MGPGPEQLPPRNPDFAGREAETALVAELLGAPRPVGAPALVALSGLGGIGKTALAIEVAWRCRDRFPDGRLHADLGGGRPRPADPAEVAAGFLAALGVPVPPGPADRSAALRSMLAERRVLVVLDDAAGEEQVRPLLPAGAGCAVLLTARRPLAALDGVRPVPVGGLPPEATLGLLARVAGPDRVAAEPGAAAEVVRLCAGLPLAVKAAAARLATRPDWRLVDLAARLTDERRRLDELAAGDLQVRSALRASCDRLDPAAREGLRLLAERAVPEAGSWLVAALLDQPDPDRVVGELVALGLLEPAGGPGPPRYRLHDLVRLLVRDRAGAGAPAAAGRPVVRRA